MENRQNQVRKVRRENSLLPPEIERTQRRGCVALIQLHSKVRLGVGAELERRLEHQLIKLNNYVATHN